MRKREGVGKCSGRGRGKLIFDGYKWKWGERGGSGSDDRQLMSNTWRA